MESFGFSGTVLVGSGDSIVFHHAYGLANDSTGHPVEIGTAFDIGSVTKQFTAFAILKLESEGKLKVTDSLSRYFPNAKLDKHDITILQLLSHTSGLLRNGEPRSKSWTRSMLVDSILESRLRAAPGEKFLYSNAAYVVLGRIIELVSGAEFEVYMKKQLFEPSGMFATGFYSDSIWPEVGVAHSYVESVDQGFPDLWNRRINTGPGGVVSTAEDLFRWTRSLHSDRIAPKGVVDKFLTSIVETDEQNERYGFGWYHSKTGRGTNLIWHSGDYSGFNSLCRMYVDEGVTLIYLGNRGYRGGVGIRVAIRDALERAWWGDSLDMPPATQPLMNPNRFVGEYWFADSAYFSVINQGKNLLIYPNGQTAVNWFCASHSNDTVLTILIGQTKTAEKIIQASLATDSTALRSLFSPEDFSLYGTFLITANANLIDSLGPPVSSKVFGTFPSSFEAGVSQSFVHLYYERDTVALFLGWQDGVMNDVTFFDRSKYGTIRTHIPSLMPIAQSPDGSLLSYDPFLKSTCRFRYDSTISNIEYWSVITANKIATLTRAL